MGEGLSHYMSENKALTDFLITEEMFLWKEYTDRQV